MTRGSRRSARSTAPRRPRRFRSALVLLAVAGCVVVLAPARALAQEPAVPDHDAHDSHPGQAADAADAVHSHEAHDADGVHDTSDGASSASPREGERAARPPLAEEGNSAFAAIREVVRELEAREDTDWTRVDLEALRQHLIDMERFTLEAEIVAREAIGGGLRLVVRGTNPQASTAIRRALTAHAPALEEETGWNAIAGAQGEATVFEVTGDTPADTEKIRALGYIGLMATGAHHAEHHRAIATGGRPHGH